MAGGGENSRRVKLKSLLMSGIHSFDVAQFVPRCLLECVCRWMDGGSVVFGSLPEMRVRLEDSSIQCGCALGS